MKEKGSSIQEIGMKFDEASSLFSGETLESMAMNDLAGGADVNVYCPSGCQGECSCGGSKGGSSSSSSSSSSSNGGNKTYILACEPQIGVTGCK